MIKQTTTWAASILAWKRLSNFPPKAMPLKQYRVVETFKLGHYDEVYSRLNS